MQPSRAVIVLALLGLSLANHRISFIGAPLEKSIEGDEAEIQQAIRKQSHPTVYEEPCSIMEVFACLLQNMQDAANKRNIQMSVEKPKTVVNGDQQQSTSVSQFSKESGLLTSEAIPEHAVPETSQVTSEAPSTLPKKNQEISIHYEKEVAATIIPTNNEQRDTTDKNELVREIEKLFKDIVERSHSTPTSFVNLSDPSTPSTTVKRGGVMNDYQATNKMSDEKPESIVNGDEQKSTSLSQFSKESPLMTKETIPDHAIPETSYPVQVTYNAPSILPEKDQDISIDDEEEVATTVIPTNNGQRDNSDGDELVRELQELSGLAALERSHSTPTPFANLIDPVTPSTTVKKSSLETDYQQLRNKKPESTVNGDEQKYISLFQFSKESPLMTKENIPDQAVLEPSYPVQVTSEAQSTLPEKDQDKPIHDEEIVTTTVIPTNNEQHDNSDEEKLVHELEELNRLALERSHSTPTPFVNLIDPVTPATPIKRSSLATQHQAANEDEKRRIEANMAKEIREMHRLGVSNNEVIEELGVNKQELPDVLKLVKVDQDTEVHKVQDSSADESMNNKISYNTWRPYASPYPAKPYINGSFVGMHINLPPMNEHVVTNQLRGGYRPYNRLYNPQMRTNPRNIQNTLRKLQRENYLLRMRLMSYTQPNGNMREIRRVVFAGPNRMSQYFPQETKYPTELFLGQNVRNPGRTPRLPPYPYISNSNIKNVTLQEDVNKSSSLVSKPLPKIVNSEFSDEMKRELRDGKVILLSDSVVRSNFEPEKGRDEGGKETKVNPPEVGQNGIWQHLLTG